MLMTDSSLSASSVIKLLLIGGGGHCRSCIDVIRSGGVYEIIGIIDVAEKVGSNLDGVPVVATDDDLSEYLAKADECLITVGQIGSASLRKKLYKKVLQHED
jgi:FlaA1/EpsC-like NDP-sugar epimerase